MTETNAEISVEPGSTPRRWDWRPKFRWFAAEYLIVVLGVLTALGMNAWWQDRQDHRMETETLREIREALVNDQSGIKRNISIHREARASALLLREHMRDRSPYADTLDTHFGRVLIATGLSTDRAAYETLKQRGMETITSDSIRAAIGRVYGSRYPYALTFEKTSLDFMMAHVFPFYNKRFRDIRLGETASPVDYPALLDSVEFAALLDWMIYMHGGQMETMGALDTDVSELISLIDEELLNR